MLEFDENGDQKLSSDEVPKCHRLAISRGSMQANPAVRTAVTPRRPRSSKAPDWFRGTDRNQDGEISRREFLGTDQQFQELDANEDNFISVGEAKTFATSGR